MIRDLTVIASGILVGMAIGLLIFVTFMSTPHNTAIVYGDDCEYYYEY